MVEGEGSELRGVVRLRIEKVAELGTESKFSKVQKIAKLPWRLEVRKCAGEGQHSPPTLAVYVWSNWMNKSMSWSCKAIVKFLIMSRDLDFIRNFEHVFSAKQPFVNWTRLLDLGSSSGGGWANNNYSTSSKGREDESLEIEAQICVNEIIGYGFPPKEDQIFVNGKPFDLLAAHSPYFRAFFFENKFRECQTQIFEIRDNEVDAEMFGAMLNCIYPENAKPNEENVEEILHLCDKYDLAVVKERCERFLVEQSKNCMVFKFRMAEHYGLTSLKNHCLKSINTIDFCANLLENISEFTEMPEESQKKLSAHLAELSANEKTKQNLASILHNGVNAQQQSGSRPSSFVLQTDQPNQQVYDL